MGEGGYIGYDAWFPIAPGHALGRYVQTVLSPPPVFRVCDYLVIRLFTSPSPLAAVTATTTGEPKRCSYLHAAIAPAFCPTDVTILLQIAKLNGCATT